MSTSAQLARKVRAAGAVAMALLAGCAFSASGEPSAEAPGDDSTRSGVASIERVQLGPRPFYLVSRLSAGPLKRQLSRCEGPFEPTEFSIGHRGAPLMFPEHTHESYRAAARMGAGQLECDVTYTRGGELVCRHAQCDLHRTTNILQTELANTCAEPFTPARFDADGERTRAAGAKCCAGALSVAQFKSLCARMDGVDPDATTVDGYLDATPSWRTDLHATCGTLMTHAESIELFDTLGVAMTPELKAPEQAGGFPFESREAYATAMIEAYAEAGIAPERVRPQSFDLHDVRSWVDTHPRFGERAVYLEPREDAIDPAEPDDPAEAGVGPTFRELAAAGVSVVAPPIWVLLTVQDGEIVPSQYARKARAAGLDIIAWTTERSGRIVADVLDGDEGYYYRSLLPPHADRAALTTDGDILAVLDVLAREVGVIGVFSDWPATTTFYANCMLP